MNCKRVSYIIVTWNNANIIKNCIDTLFQFSTVENEVIVVDNNSDDGTCLVIKDNYGERVRLIETGENLGFSKANNVGVEVATGDYIFFVNPDVIFVENIITPMVNILDTHSEIGIVSPMLVYKDGSYQVSSCNFPSAKKVFWDDCHFYKLLSKAKQNELAQAQCRYKGNRYVDWTYGAAHLCRVSDLQLVGGYPEGYFMYGEDTEFCMLFLDKLGKRTYYYGDCCLIHLGGYSERQVVNSKKIVYGTNAAMYFVSKYYGKMSLIHYQVILWIASFIKHIVARIKYRINRNQKNRNDIIRWKNSWQTILKYKGQQN